MKKVSIPLGASELKVSVIDKDKLLEKINKIIGKEVNLYPDYYGLLITENNHYLIDHECCGVKENDIHLFYQDKKKADCISAIAFDVPFRKKPEHTINADGNKVMSFSVIPTHKFTLDIDFLEDCIVEEIPLYLFMGNRFNYNGRIASNMDNIIKDVGVDKYRNERVEVDEWRD